MAKLDTKENKEKPVEIQTAPRLLYNINDRTPIYLTVFFAFQQTLVSLSSTIAMSFLVAEVACAENDDEIKAQLLSSLFVMNGIATFVCVIFGIRLPLFQGSAGDYVVPLLAIMTLDPDRCSKQKALVMANYGNETLANFTMGNGTMSAFIEKQVILENLRVFEGCLILVGVLHFLVGATGLVGVVLKLIGPITIVPTILLSGIFVMRAVTKFSKVFWGVSSLTAGIAIILSLYLAHKKAPIPIWTPSKGFRIIWYPLHQVFSVSPAIDEVRLQCARAGSLACYCMSSVTRTWVFKLLIAIMTGWLVSAILTFAGVFSDDPKSPDFFARTDARSQVIEDFPWFYIPYPGQFGPPSFNAAVFIAFTIATLTSILDSIGDYYACAKMCNVPPPPSHAVNRGIATEGLCSLLSGAVGCGAANTTIGGNIGAIGVTKVASRDVFIGVGCINVILGIVGKFAAAFVTIPYPVLGGSMIMMFGMFNGVVLSNLQGVSLSSSRNLAIMGTAILVGLMIPHWIETTPDALKTGNDSVDNALRMLLANPNLSCGVFACFLDNTIPGSDDERGISAWQNVGNEAEEIGIKYAAGREIYEPWLPKSFFKSKFAKYLPFCPYIEHQEYNLTPQKENKATV